MPVIFVIEDPTRWGIELPNTLTVSAAEYLRDARYARQRRLRVVNLCRSNEYQSTGYYVSLLAEARGHRPTPSVATVQDLRDRTLLPLGAPAVQELAQKSLEGLKTERFELSLYFGRNLAKRYDRLSQALFELAPAPLMRAEFLRGADELWRLRRLRLISVEEIPESHWDFVRERAQRYFSRAQREAPASPRFELGILYDPAEEDAPSDERAIQRFLRAAKKLGVGASVITRQDYGRLREFDALFIRETTAVNHHSYRFARRAEAEGLVVLDDPTSILRCTNKVYQAEVLARAGIPHPRTTLVHKDNLEAVAASHSYPCVIKQPDSAFSLGVVKAADAGEFRTITRDFLRRSAFVVVQEYLPSSFDWRIGLIDGEPLYACRYHMARGHWQIQVNGPKRRYGRHDTLPVEDAPREVVEVARRAAALIGDGLYGVDLKEVEGRVVVMEINDNPSIEAGVEDAVLGDALYQRIMQSFYTRVERRLRRES